MIYIVCNTIETVRLTYFFEMQVIVFLIVNNYTSLSYQVQQLVTKCNAIIQSLIESVNETSVGESLKFVQGGMSLTFEKVLAEDLGSKELDLSSEMKVTMPKDISAFLPTGFSSNVLITVSPLIGYIYEIVFQIIN